MPARTATPLKNAKRHVVELAQIAFRELSLAGTFNTRADEDRLWRMFRGMEFLDKLLSDWKAKVDDLIEQYELTKDATKLVAGIKTLNTPIRLKDAEEYERDLQKLSWGDAMTLVSDRMEDIEDFDEPTMTALVELLTDKPVKLTSSNPRLR